MRWERTDMMSNEPPDSINPLSADFDPLAALNSHTIAGLEEVEPLANLQQYEEYQANPEQFLRSQAERKEKDELRKAAKLNNAKNLEALTSAEKPKPLQKNVLTRMQRIEGPTSLLQRWVTSRTKVKVITRSFKSVRGTCIGYILAFDRYMNLAMVDVDETYCSLYTDNCGTTTHTSGQVDGGETELLVKRVEALNITTSANVRHRHLNQLFIRGDNIVSVSAC